jgi:hypothetical protein
MLTSLEYKCVNKTNTPSPKGFQSAKFSDSDFREVPEVRGLGRPKSSGVLVHFFFRGKITCALLIGLVKHV